MFKKGICIIFALFVFSFTMHCDWLKKLMPFEPIRSCDCRGVYLFDEFSIYSG